MAQFNPDFWEIPTKSSYMENLSAERALWYETEEDRERRYALEDFFKSVMPAVRKVMEKKLTRRQREILELYYIEKMTQEDIAETLRLSQSTVSRHLFGTSRNGRKVGGAIPKLRKAIDRTPDASISAALETLRNRFEQAA